MEKNNRMKRNKKARKNELRISIGEEEMKIRRGKRTRMQSKSQGKI